MYKKILKDEFWLVFPIFNRKEIASPGLTDKLWILTTYRTKPSTGY